MMRSALACGVALVLAAVAPAGGEREEQLRLKGTWELVELGYVGAVKPVGSKNFSITIIGDKMTLSAKVTWVLRLAPTREPREVDLTVVAGTTSKSKVYKGIYKLEGDTFTIHYTLTGDRPKNFTDGADNKVRVMKLKRVNKPK